jgi:hypothetical protein
VVAGAEQVAGLQLALMLARAMGQWKWRLDAAMVGGQVLALPAMMTWFGVHPRLTARERIA